MNAPDPWDSKKKSARKKKAPPLRTSALIEASTDEIVDELQRRCTGLLLSALVVCPHEKWICKIKGAPVTCSALSGLMNMNIQKHLKLCDDLTDSKNGG